MPGKRKVYQYTLSWKRFNILRSRVYYSTLLRKGYIVQLFYEKGFSILRPRVYCYTLSQKGFIILKFREKSIYLTSNDRSVYNFNKIIYYYLLVTCFLQIQDNWRRISTKYLKKRNTMWSIIFTYQKRASGNLTIFKYNSKLLKNQYLLQKCLKYMYVHKSSSIIF